MKLTRFSLLLLPALLVLFAVSSFAQGQAFSDPNVEYGFEVPNQTWKMTGNLTVTSPNVEYTYGDRTAGYLEIRKLSAKAEDLTADVIVEEEEKLKFLQGYIAGKQENFAGKYRGMVFNYEYIRAGRNMSGRLYFLRVNPTTVYLLRFTGYKDKLIAIRNQTDSIARTFRIKNQ